MADVKTARQDADRYSTAHLDAKIPIDIGRGLATLLIGMAAFLIALAGIVGIEGEEKACVQIMLLFASLTILLAAKIMDWMLDRIRLETWASLYQISSPKGMAMFEREFYKWGGAYFRTRIYGGAYLIFAILISFVAATSLYFAIERVQSFGVSFSVSDAIGWKTSFKVLVCLLLFLYIPYEMLTIKPKWGRVFFFGAVFVISILVVEAIIRQW